MPPTRRAHRSPNRRGAAVAPKIKSGMETKTLRFQCPNTGLEVDSGISARCSTRLISIRVRYPICEKPHEWQVADGSFSSINRPPLRRRSISLGAEHPSGCARLNFPEPSTEIMELGEQLLDELNHKTFLDVASTASSSASANPLPSGHSQ